MRISDVGPFGRSPRASLSCLICDNQIDLGRSLGGGFTVSARVLYARLNGKNVPVAVAHDYHFKGERRRVHRKKGGDAEEFVDPDSVELLRSTESRSAPGGTEDDA